ncbi:unnamed protein product [Closterium sp. NIES-64]|nr:unnamed protein product [Closterium sp. NIES-64]
MKLTSLVASFAYRPSSALLRCLLSLLLTCSARFRSLLENLGVAPLPAVVPDSLVVALLEGVMEEHNLLLIFCGTHVIAQEERFDAILEPVGQEGGVHAGRARQQQQHQGEEEWRMWEEVNSWRMAAGNAWPALEEHGSTLLWAAPKGAGLVEEEVLDECCAGMSGAIGGTGNVEGWRGKAVASYLEPWAGGGGDPLRV